jgi:hypothetical protein
MRSAPRSRPIRATRRGRAAGWPYWAKDRGSTRFPLPMSRGCSTITPRASTRIWQANSAIADPNSSPPARSARFAAFFALYRSRLRNRPRRRRAARTRRHADRRRSFASHDRQSARVAALRLAGSRRRHRVSRLAARSRRRSRHRRRRARLYWRSRPIVLGGRLRAGAGRPPRGLRRGHGWYWKQPNVPHVAEFVATVKKPTGKVPTARTWLGHTATWTYDLVANQEKTLDAVKLARALGGFHLPPKVALMPGAPFYRAGDHELFALCRPCPATGRGRRRPVPCRPGRRRVDRGSAGGRGRLQDGVVKRSAEPQRSTSRPGHSRNRPRQTQNLIFRSFRVQTNMYILLALDFEFLNLGFIKMVRSLLAILALTVLLVASTTGAEAYWYHWHYWHPHYWWHPHYYYWHPWHRWHRWWW